MPLYTYTCETCGREVDLQSSIAERNEPKTAPHKTSEDEPCEGQLKRGEVVEETGFTPYSWQP